MILKLLQLLCAKINLKLVNKLIAKGTGTLAGLTFTYVKEKIRYFIWQFETLR